MSEAKPYLNLTEAEVKSLRTRYPKLTDDEFNAFMDAAERYRLDPVQSQIYPQLTNEGNSWRKVVPVCQIDGYRKIAHSTGLCAGISDGVFADEKSIFKTQKDDVSATVTVMRIVSGQKCAFVATARWSEYYADSKNPMVQKMPHVMLAKCAEALALRKAFPAELSGLYTVDEMRQADAGPQIQDNAGTREVPEIENTAVDPSDTEPASSDLDLDATQPEPDVPDVQVEPSPPAKPELSNVRKKLADALVEWTGFPLSGTARCIRPLAWASGVDTNALTDECYQKMLDTVVEQSESGASWQDFEQFCLDRID